jgi:hypothetical protein
MSIKTIVGFIEALKRIHQQNDYEYFYRGHSDFNFELMPSIYRAPKSKKINSLIAHEDKIFREIIIRTPNDFVNEKSTIEKLVKMQHYGLPTRILDITSNPLVALFYACSHPNANDGEVIVFKIPKDEIKFYDSDTVSILANLSNQKIHFDITKSLIKFYKTEEKRLKYKEENIEFKRTGKIKILLENGTFQIEEWNRSQSIKYFNEQEPVQYLLHEIKNEKPQFMPIMEPTDFNRVLVVRVKLNNNRILKQSGAFLLFGIDKKKSKPAIVPKEWVLNKSVGRFDFKINNNKKSAIRKDLDTLGINGSTLYPELEQQAKYIKHHFEVVSKSIK